MNNKFTIAIGSYNNAKWADANITSVLSQDYSNYEVLYYDDNSSDGTFDKAKSLIGNNPKFKLYNSTERKYKTWFFANHLNEISDNTILVFLDGDDMFSSENVLSYLNEIYNQTNCWMTYGGMRVWSGGDNISEPYPQNSESPSNIMDNKAYRQDVWRYSHLKSMRGFLWKKFDKKDLIFENKYQPCQDDLSIMFSTLEMCPKDKIFRVEDPIYIYNGTMENGGSRGCTELKDKSYLETIIRNRKKYDEISFVTPTLAGGLGNQLFQIATAASLSKDNNATIIVNDNEHILPNQGRNINVYTDNIFSKITFDKSIPPIKNVYTRDSHIYEPIPYSNNLRINGHFQSWKYFHHNKKYICDLFLNKSIMKELDSKYPNTSMTTAIQVRRGDYIKFPNHHPMLPVEYYKKAVELSNASQILISSDDINWCKENLKFNVPVTYIKDEDYNEMYVISKCKNIIISNSSFGWWSAYLNNIDGSKIFAPSIWFGKAIASNESYINELLLPEWIKI